MKEDMKLAEEELKIEKEQIRLEKEEKEKEEEGSMRTKIGDHDRNRNGLVDESEQIGGSQSEELERI